MNLRRFRARISPIHENLVKEDELTSVRTIAIYERREPARSDST
jgi:hypothetical protein